MNLIVVDDEPKIKNGLLKLLNAYENWEVIGVFSDAKEAFEYLKNNDNVDVMITDIRMPEISGLELIKLIREQNKNIQIIILSGYSDFSYAQKAIELGVNRYLTKPTNTRELVAALKIIEDSLDIKSELIENRASNLEVEATNLIVSKTISYIELNYSKKITLKEIADELYISPNYLCKLFKEEVNKNLMEYITEYRMEKAKKYLKDLKYRVSEVAEMVGYSDTKYFSSTFKKIFKVTPLEFRNKK